MASKPKTDRNTEYLPLDALKSDPRNPKAHDLDLIDASVGRFGFIEPFVRDDRTGYLISGHGRKKALTAMKERGESPPDGVVLDKDGNWLVPVAVGWSSRTDAEARAALIALNRSTEMGGWVDESLLDLLTELSEQDDGLLGVGFNDDSLLILQERVAAAQSQDFFADLAGDAPKRSTFNSQDGWDDPSKEETVELKISMTVEQRRVILSWLNDLKEATGADTLAEALLGVAEREVADVA